MMSSLRHRQRYSLSSGGPFIAVPATAAVLVSLAVLLMVRLTAGDILWTPILPTQPDQTDLWTLTPTGCPCEGEGATGKTRDCACCVPRVACPCGAANPHRCAQCGLQHHCNKMCNVTIDGALLSVSAGTLGGSLVAPPSLMAPLYCWYSLRAPPGHRVELQLHRLIHVGSSINGTACRGGYVEISDGDNRAGGLGDEESVGEQGKRGREDGHLQHDDEQENPHRRELGHTSIRICGQDQRLHPPAVVFSDTGRATIIYRVSEQQGRPRFMFYYNFPPATDPTTGNMQWGGVRVQYTACDWLYQDVHCTVQRPCHLTSPGHPGLFPPDTRCKYLFAMAGSAVTGTLTFGAMDLPPDRCSTSYLALYSGTSTSSALITTLCGSDARTVTFSGPSVLLEFSTGPFLPPYKYSGFHATVHFNEVAPHQTTPGTRHTTPPQPPDDGVLSDPNGVHVGPAADCLRVFWGNTSSSGRFDTSAYIPHSIASTPISTLSVDSSPSSSVQQTKRGRNRRPRGQQNQGSYRPHETETSQKGTKRSSVNRRRARMLNLSSQESFMRRGRTAEMTEFFRSSLVDSPSLVARDSSIKHCRLRFIGSQDEVIQISLFKYQLGGSKCSSEAAIYDGIAEDNGNNLLRHICGPVTREPKDANDNFLQPELFTSTSSVLEVHIKFGRDTDPSRQFLAGAYQFHNSHLSGTKKPNSACDVMFYGASSSPHGVIRQPGASLLWNMEGPLSCSYLMVPAVNQSLMLTLRQMTGVRGSRHCATYCGAEGCQCRPVQLPLNQVDHILFVDTKKQRIIGCLCGDMQRMPLMSLRSTGGVDIKYHLGHYSWLSPGFNFTLEYEFPMPLVCGQLFRNTPAGLLVPPSEENIPSNAYLFTTCPWVIEIPMEVILTVVVQPPTNGSCATWNLTGGAFTRSGGWQGMGDVCGGSKRRTLSYRADHSAAAITLHQSGRPLRDWLINWRSQRSGLIITDGAHATPKPEHSRTQHSHPSRKTYTVQSSSASKTLDKGLLLALAILMMVLGCCPATRSWKIEESLRLSSNSGPYLNTNKDYEYVGKEKRGEKLVQNRIGDSKYLISPVTKKLTVEISTKKCHLMHFGMSATFNFVIKFGHGKLHRDNVSCRLLGPRNHFNSLRFIIVNIINMYLFFCDYSLWRKPNCANTVIIPAGKVRYLYSNTDSANRLHQEIQTVVNSDVKIGWQDSMLQNLQFIAYAEQSQNDIQDELLPHFSIKVSTPDAVRKTVKCKKCINNWTQTNHHRPKLVMDLINSEPISRSLSAVNGPVSFSLIYVNMYKKNCHTFRYENDQLHSEHDYRVQRSLLCGDMYCECKVEPMMFFLSLNLCSNGETIKKYSPLESIASKLFLTSPIRCFVDR